jgi:hypothetical protein
MSIAPILFKNIDDIFKIAELARPSIKTTFTTRKGKKIKTQEKENNIPQIIFEPGPPTVVFKQKIEAANKIIDAYNKAGKSTKMKFVVNALGYGVGQQSAPGNLAPLLKPLNNRAQNALVQFEKLIGDTSKTPVENVFEIKRTIAKNLGLSKAHGVDFKLYQNSPLWKKFDVKIGNFFDRTGLGQKNFMNSILAEQEAIGKKLTIDEAFEYYLGRTKNGTKNLNQASGLSYRGPISSILRYATIHSKQGGNKIVWESGWDDSRKFIVDIDNLKFRYLGGPDPDKVYTKQNLFKIEQDADKNFAEYIDIFNRKKAIEETIVPDPRNPGMFTEWNKLMKDTYKKYTGSDQQPLNIDHKLGIKEDPFKDGGRVELSVGGLANSSRGGIGLDDRLSKVGTLESMLAGVGAGLIDIPKGAFTLGAALLDLGFGTSNAAKVEKYFDELTNLDEKAEATFAGDLTRIMVNLGVPGGFAFKKGTELATKALLHKRNGNYFKLTDPKLQERFKTSLNNKGRLFATLGGAGAAGVSDMIFVGDPEHVGTIGDMFGGPTQLKPNDEKNAAREVANRIKFGLDSSLLIGAIGGTGSSIKSLIRRSNDLQTNNDSIDKFLSYLRPRGKKTQEFFDIERENLGLRRSDINRAEEVSRKLDKHIDAIFPFVKNPFNKLGNDGRREFMQKLNDTLLSGDYKISPETGKTEFGLMDKDKVKEITEMMIKKGGSEKDVKGVMEQFYNIRSGWQLMFDDLGTAMGKDALTEFAPLFGKKFKDYLGSTYEIFRNKSVIPMLNYKPTEQAVKKMIKLFKESASEKGVNLGDEQAEYYVNELLASARPPRAIATTSEKTSGVYFNAPDFFINKTTLADMEMPPKTLPLESLTDDAKKVVDELLGKVEDPLQTILTGTNKLSLVTRRNQLFQTLNKSNQEILEKRAAFIKENPGKEIPAALRGMFRETELEAINDLGKNIKKIELDPSRTEEAGIVNPLDGMYAERGVAEAIEETAMIAKDKSSLFQLYQSTLLYPKATSQMAKTILSPITHARNFISAGAFAAANGLIPGLTVSFDDTGRAFKEAYGALQIPGARIDNTRYRELLRLGVVNNNVRLGDLQKLLKDVNFGESFDSNVALRNMMRPLSKAKKWTEDMYTAEDDFWKITTFALERSRLKDTYDKYGVKYTNELLDDEAAKIVKNNVPNYDYVNDFVKDLRQLPFGNFVSFPAEIYRTSFNIMNQSWKEIFTPHTLDDGRIVYPLRNIGLKRMFGFSSTVVGIPYGTVEAFKAIHDVTDEEMSALRRFVPDWSKNSTLVPIRDEDGSLKYIDFSHANAYDTMIRPITTMINGVQKGLEEDQVFKNVFLSMIDATKETASPFVSESIWTEALFDVSPIFGRGGRTSEGRRLWTDETPWGDAFYAGIKHLGATVVPGSLPAMGRMRDALTETVDEYGRSYEFLDEALGVAGMRVVDVDPARSMKFKIADFRTGINNSRREFTGPLLKGGPITPEQVVDQYQKANESLFRVQQKMFKDYYAARTLGVTDRALQNTFQDRVSDKQVQAIRTGRFTPFVPSENIAQAFADNAREIGEPDAFKSALSQIRRLIRNYQKLTLGNTFPIIDNPFRMPVTQNITGPLSQITGTPLDNTSLSQPLTGNQQVATAQRGQQVFGSNDPIFGVG